MANEQEWTQYATERLVGRTIIGARYLTPQECRIFGWSADERPLALVLDDGALLFPSQDDEGNGPGALLGQGPPTDQPENWTFAILRR